MYIIDSPLCLRNFIGKCFQPVIVVGIKAVSAFSVPFGNDVHIPSVFGKWRLYIVPEGYFCIWNWSDGMEPKNLHMCGNLRWSDA